MIYKLVKINYAALFGSIFLRGRKGKRMSGVVVALLSLAIAVPFAVMFGGMFYGMRDIYFQSGLGWLYFAMQLAIVFMMCVMTTIFQAYAQVFNAKDNDMLLAMPLRPSAILTARILTMLGTEYAFELVIAGPAFVIWLVGGYGHWAGIVFFVFGFLLTPLLALAVASLLAWIIAVVTSFIRRKNIITIILALAFFIAYFWFCGNIKNYIVMLINNGSEIGKAFERAVFPAYHFGRAVADGSFVSFILFALCAIVPFVLIIALLSANFARIVTRNKGVRRIEYREREMKTSGVIPALLVKELGRFASRPMIALNMAVGSVMVLIGAGFLVLRRDMIVEGIAMYTELMAWMTPAVIATVVMLFCAGTSPASASLISIEGKMLWLMRSLPISGRDALLAKLYMHFIVATAPVTIAAIVAAVAFAENVFSAAVIFLTPTLFAVLFGMGGLILNLLKPKFDWINEMQPIKQGIPVMIAMFGSWAVLIAVSVAIAMLSPLLTVYVVLLLLDCVFLACCIAMFRWLVTSGERRWDRLEP